MAKSLTSVYKNFGAYAFCISFLFTGHFIFGNLFVAVVIEQIDRGKIVLKFYTVFFDLVKNMLLSKCKTNSTDVTHDLLFLQMMLFINWNNVTIVISDPQHEGYIPII